MAYSLLLVPGTFPASVRAPHLDVDLAHIHGYLSKFGLQGLTWPGARRIGVPMLLAQLNP